MKKQKTHWDYRIGTYVFSYKKTFEKTSPKLAEFPDERLFSIVEVHYVNDVPGSWGDKPGNLVNSTDPEDLKAEHERIAAAFERPILDLDNLPNEWKQS